MIRKKRTAKPSSRRLAPDPVALLAWYDRHRRVLPWRARPGEAADPYHVWLSEIMLQQTTVKAVGPYYAQFLARWPDVKKLAAAPLDDVLRAWAGLGYYARARNLHACARAVVERHGGRFPDTVEALRALPGIGTYTAAAIAAIAFDALRGRGRGNIERASRFMIEPASAKPHPARREFHATKRPGDYTGDDDPAPPSVAEKSGLRAVPVCRNFAAPRRSSVSAQAIEGSCARAHL